MPKRRDWKKKHTHEMILSRHQGPGPFPFILVLDHLKAGYNVGKIIRVGNALGCREIHMIGIPPFDTTPSKGSLKHTKTRIFQDFKSSYEFLIAEGYEIYALDPQGENILGQAPFAEKCAFVLGHEEYGLSFKTVDFPAVRGLRILQFGRVQSLNVSIAASLASYEYLRQRNFMLSLKPSPAGPELIPSQNSAGAAENPIY